VLYCCLTQLTDPACPFLQASSACSQFGEGGRLLIRVVGSSTGSNGAAAAAGSRRAGSGSLLMNQMSSALP
jgi:hypothetical protein